MWEGSIKNGKCVSERVSTKNYTYKFFTGASSSLCAQQNVFIFLAI